MSLIQMQFRRGTAAQWTSANPVLADGELGLEKDTRLFKIGDGTTAWNALAYGGLMGPQGPQGIQGNTGATGSQGTQGTQGVPGQGVPTGGAADTFLLKNTGTTYDTGWRTPAQVAALLPLATGSAQGMLSALDKKIIDNLHYDAVADFGWVGNDSTDNLAAFNAMIAALPVGATVFFPPGTYRVSGELNINVDKRIRFRGGGRYSSIIKTTSATANIFNKTVAGWYDTWEDLGFQSSVTKTAGAAIAITSGNSVGMNVYRCWMTGMFIGIDAQGSQSANLSVWSDLDISAVANGGRGIRINGDTINVMIHNATINAGAATTSACCEINQSGAVQVTASDWIQGTNVVLINSTGGAGPQAVYFTNCFFDQPQGSVVKITGARTANRIKFTQCGIAPTGNNHAVEINGTGAGGVGTQTALPAGLSFVDCDIYSQNGTNTGSGILVNGCQDVNIQSCRITGFAGVGGCGIQVTPSAGGVTSVRINGCIIGPNSNLTVVNETGIKVNAGTIGRLTITDNAIYGWTSAGISDASTTAYPNNKSIDFNDGAQPLVGPIGRLTAAVATSGTGATLILTAKIPAKILQVGTVFRYAIHGVSSSTGTVAVTPKIGTAGTAADATIVAATSAAQVANQWAFIEGIVTVTALGTTGQVKGSARGTAGTVAWHQPAAAIANGAGQQAVNTTVDNFITLAIACSVGTFTAHQAYIDVVSAN